MRKHRPLQFPEPRIEHSPKHPRPHLAQEFMDHGREELAKEMTSGLRPHFAMCAQGRVSVEFARTRTFKIKKLQEDNVQEDNDLLVHLAEQEAE